MKTMQYIVSVCLLALALQTTRGQAISTGTPVQPQIRLDTATGRLGKAFIAESGRVGLSVGIVQGGRTYFYNFGTTEKDRGLFPTANTRYEIGSISKTFASLLLAKAVLEKRVTPADDVRKYLKGEYPNLAFRGKPIRLIHLVNTTSALPDNVPLMDTVFRQANPDSIPFLAAEKLGRYTEADFFADLRTLSPDTVPGLVPRHSNVAAQLLGYILESVYQAPYRELVKKYIEDPLRMGEANNADVLARGYNAKGDIMPYLDMKALLPVGGLQYSTSEMVKYLAYQLNERDEAVKLTHRAAWGDPDQQAVGFNWRLDKTIDGKRRLSHTGGTFGFAAYSALYPDQNLGIVLLANQSDRTAQGRLVEITDQIVEALYGVPPVLQALRAELAANGYEQAIDVFKRIKKKYPQLHLTQDYVNEWGYTLLGGGQTQQAIGLFKLNVHLYPGSYNTYDSLGEAYERAGNQPLAIQNYKRSLALHPGNANAAARLKDLSADSSRK